MVSRIITCTIRPEKVDEFREAVNYEFLPRIQEQRGFLENVESFDPASGKFHCMTLWSNEEDVRNYDEGLFQEIAGRLAPMMASGPSVETLPVDNASAHGLHGGRMEVAA